MIDKDSINVKKNTKIEFDKLQFDLKMKGKKKNQDELVKMLIHFWNINNKLKKIRK